MGYNKIVALSISLLMIGIIVPIGLAQLETFTSTNTSVYTLMTTAIPVIGIIGLVIGLYKDSNN